jgi:hypothetical protein
MAPKCQIAIGKGLFCLLGVFFSYQNRVLKREKESDKNTPKKFYESDKSIPFFLSLFSSPAPVPRYQTLLEV